MGFGWFPQVRVEAGGFGFLDIGILAVAGQRHEDDVIQQRVFPEPARARESSSPVPAGEEDFFVDNRRLGNANPKLVDINRKLADPNPNPKDLFFAKSPKSPESMTTICSPKGYLSRKLSKGGTDN